MIFLTSKEASELLKIDERSIQRYALNGKYGKETEGYIYTSGRGRGGKQLKIALAALPEDVQEEYLRTADARKLKQEVERESTCRAAPQQQYEADYKKQVVESYLYFSENLKRSGFTADDFLEHWNSEHPDHPVTLSAVYRWLSKFNSGGYDALVDKRGYSKKGYSSIPAEAWTYFKSLWLSETRPSKAQCYEMTKAHFPTMKLPSLNTFRNQVANSIPQAAIVYYRNGKKAFEDNYASTCIRDLTNMSSNQYWVADHHIFDVLVNCNGEIGRPWMSAWQDLRSKKIVGYVLNMVSNPNANIVIDSFAHAVERFGIPECVLLDNGKDYKAFDMFNNENFLSISNRLQISVVNANPYNAKSKPIERYFKTLEEKYCKFLPSYVGNDPKKRPEKLSVTNKKVKDLDLAMPYDDFVKLVAKIVEDYNNTPHSGNGMNNRTPNEIYKTSFKKPLRLAAGEDGITLQSLFLRATKGLSVTKNGVRVKVNNTIGYKYYDCDELIRIRGKKVIVHYRGDDTEKVYVHDLLDRYLCTAYMIRYSTQTGSENDLQAIKDTQHKNRKLREIVRAAKPDIPEANIATYLDERKSAYDVDELEGVEKQFSDIPESIMQEERAKAQAEQRRSGTAKPDKVTIDTDVMQKLYEHMMKVTNHREDDED